MFNLINRPRRNRKSDAVRRLVRQTILTPNDLILPMFVMQGGDTKEEIPSIPDCFRFGIKAAVQEAREAFDLGIPAVALFPKIDDALKDSLATESANPDGLLQHCVQELKSAVPDLVVITDVAMDPYSSDGHDGIVENGEIINDKTLQVLASMSVAQAKAGADIVAPSDMMDGRVGFIRKALDESGFSQVSILAYSAKYASSFYGPFRDALDSAPQGGDKKTYQMDTANVREAEREVLLDVAEGADMVMVKPALPYLDVIARVRQVTNLPLAAYNVSGEYSMVKAAAKMGWIDEEAIVKEVLTSIKRAGADMILTYFAKSVAPALNRP